MTVIPVDQWMKPFVTLGLTQRMDWKQANVIVNQMLTDVVVTVAGMVSGTLMKRVLMGAKVT